MILVIDVGNTNIILGIYEGNDLLASWKLTTDNTRTADEMGMLLYNFLQQSNIEPEDLENGIISSVVPDIMFSLMHGIHHYLKIDPMVVGPGMKTGINIKLENPKELGADRLVNSVAAYEIYGGPLIIVNYSTATTYDVISKDGVFVTGITAPGIKICAEALSQKAALLQKVEIKKPESIIAKNTIASIQSGLVYGHIGETIYIIQKLKEEIDPQMKVIATGGLARIIDENGDIFDDVNPLLTLEGLKILYYKNK